MTPTTRQSTLRFHQVNSSLLRTCCDIQIIQLLLLLFFFQVLMLFVSLQIVQIKTTKRKMVNRIVIILCLATLIIGIAGKPLHKESNGRSILKLKLTKDDLNRGVSIQITNKPSGKDQPNLVHHLMPIIGRKARGRKLARRENQVRKGRRFDAAKRQMIKKQSRILKALAARENDTTKTNLATNKVEKSIVVPYIRSMRNKRSLPLKKMIGNSELQVEDLRKLIEDDENADGEDYSDEEEEEESFKRRKSGSHRQEKQDNTFLNSEDYRDYAFDTADTDQSKDEDDDLLQRYYGRVNHDKRALFDDYDSFTDVMHRVSDQSRRDTRNMKGLFYGDNDVLNDEDGDDDNNESEYDEYYDDSF